MPGPSTSLDSRTDRRLLLLNPDDNVLVTRAPIASGEEIVVEDSRVTIIHGLATGHKLARNDIRAGEKVRKYGAPIGTASAAISRGEHVHVHNVHSDYTSSIFLDGTAP